MYARRNLANEVVGSEQFLDCMVDAPSEARRFPSIPQSPLEQVEEKRRALRAELKAITRTQPWEILCSVVLSEDDLTSAQAFCKAICAAFSTIDFRAARTARRGPTIPTPTKTAPNGRKGRNFL